MAEINPLVIFHLNYYNKERHLDKSSLIRKFLAADLIAKV